MDFFAISFVVDIVGYSDARLLFAYLKWRRFLYQT